mmetsp:Transcript_25273/g.72779  ORF Transcript_25273/g.72779 Transcript_25273/m.72779 type:complete len:202 (+) Transcript_25273:1329-1934(+)
MRRSTTRSISTVPSCVAASPRNEARANCACAVCNCFIFTVAPARVMSPASPRCFMAFTTSCAWATLAPGSKLSTYRTLRRSAERIFSSDMATAVFRDGLMPTALPSSEVSGDTPSGHTLCDSSPVVIVSGISSPSVENWLSLGDMLCKLDGCGGHQVVCDGAAPLSPAGRNAKDSMLLVPCSTSLGWRGGATADCLSKTSS